MDEVRQTSSASHSSEPFEDKLADHFRYQVPLGVLQLQCALTSLFTRAESLSSGERCSCVDPVLVEALLAWNWDALDTSSDSTVTSSDSDIPDLEELPDFDKKNVEEILGSVSNESFAQLINLSGKRVTDCGVEDEQMVDTDV